MSNSLFVAILLPVKNDKIDWVAFEEQVNILCDSRVHGIYTNGTAAECHNQTEQEFDKLSEIVSTIAFKKKKKFQHKHNDDKPKSESLENDIDFKKKQEIVSETPSRGIKSIVVSGIKYIYIVAAAALFSGIFTPLTLGVDVEEVFSGILTVLLGLAGGVIIYL